MVLSRLQNTSASLTGEIFLLSGQTLSDLFCTEVGEFRVAVLHSCLAGGGIRGYFHEGYF